MVNEEVCCKLSEKKYARKFGTLEFRKDLDVARE